jgi:hypothetical protein
MTANNKAVKVGSMTGATLKECVAAADVRRWLEELEEVG